MAPPRRGVRVIAGTAKGRRLDTPDGHGTRPVTDRVKESIFGMLTPWIEDATVLDLYAGSGAMAIEALSRGAARALLVERDAKAVHVIERNLAAVGFAGLALARRGDVHAVLGRGPTAADGAPFDLVFLDPPYAMPDDEVEADLSALRSGWVAAGSHVVLRRRTGGEEPSPPAGFEFTRTRTYGDTLVLVATAAA